MARLLSVNVGLPREVAWNGRTVRTGIWKNPVAGRRRVRRLNVDGDGQGDLAGHGGEQRAVFVYQIESYRHWEAALGRADFVPGQFGENFTVEGLADDEVCIGDRYRIGEALFEVTQPRVTCYRVGIRLDEPRMPALLTASGRPGFYFRVLEEGEVAAGDAVAKVADGAGGMTVAEVNALLYSPPHPPEQLRRAIALPALSPGWRGSFQALLDNPADGNAGLAPAAAGHPARPGFTPLKVAAIVRETADVASIVLEPPAGQTLALALPGQFVVLRLRPGDGTPILRSYSLSGRASATRYRISVKLEPHGLAGGYLHHQVKVGDVLEVSAPRGTFVLEDSARPAVLLSAGIGATPVLAMLEALAAAASSRSVTWLHAARDGAHQAFAGEVRGLLAALPQARRYVCFSRPAADDVAGRDFDAAGRLSAAALEAAALSAEAEVYLCGPPAFMADMTALLGAAGVPAGRIRTERFEGGERLEPGVVEAAARPPHRPAHEPASGPMVAFARSGLAVRWDAAAYPSLLDLAEACDVPVRWSCRAGVCHSCESGLVSGTVTYRPEPLDGPADGNLLLCCAQPAGDVVLDL